MTTLFATRWYGLIHRNIKLNVTLMGYREGGNHMVIKREGGNDIVTNRDCNHMIIETIIWSQRRRQSYGHGEGGYIHMVIMKDLII